MIVIALLIIYEEIKARDLFRFFIGLIMQSSR